MARLILDSGALIALSRRDSRVRAFLDRANRHRDLIVIPAVVVAETTRGGARDAPINQILKAVDEIAPVTENVARMAGRLMGASGLSHATVDALVVAEAVRAGPAIVLTSDKSDLSLLAGEHKDVLVYHV